MKISYCGIGNISFIADEKTYVGEVMFQTKGDERLSGMQKISSHDVEITIRIKGERSWPFERIQSEILSEAASLLGLAREHIGGATIESLAQYNAVIDQENEAEREAELSETLSKAF